MHLLKLLPIALAGALFTSIAAAEEAPTSEVHSALQPGHRRHDGFFLRMTVGPAAGGTSYRARPTLPGASAEVHTVGGGTQTELAIGVAVIEDLILHANLQLAYLSGLKKRGSGAYDADDEVDTLTGFVGGGLTYYLMPANVYLTASIGAGGLSETRGPRHEDFESEIGLGTSLGVGKEWWVGRSGEWGVGFALTGTYHRANLTVDGLASKFQGYGGAGVFSATYN